jgi:radical SAM superfamily enzyme YgiQ (UPF0313 family)
MWLQFLRGSEGSWMNHGLASLAAALREKGHDVSLVDLRRLKGWDHFRRVIHNGSARVFGLTMMSVDRDHVIRAATMIREEKPEATIIVGGPHPSICSEELEALDCFDHIVKGEGELSFPLVLDQLEKHRSLDRVLTGKRIGDLDELPSQTETFSAWRRIRSCLFSSRLSSPSSPGAVADTTAAIASRRNG